MIYFQTFTYTSLVEPLGVPVEVISFWTNHDTRSWATFSLPGGDESYLKDCMPWMAGQIPNSKLLMVEGALKWR